MKIKRKARMTKKNQKVDLTIPVQIQAIDLGSDKDPCYGKHYSVKASECKRCGDYEVCAAVTMQRMHTAAGKQEKKLKFKDKEEAEYFTEQQQMIATMMEKRAAKKEGWCSIDKLVPKLLIKLNLTEKEIPSIVQRCIQAVKLSHKIELNKSLTKYKTK